MPERVFQGLGDGLTRALITGDYGLYASILMLPMKFTTKEGTAYVLPDDAALREDFDLYVSIIKLHGVTDIYRQLTAYEADGADGVWVHWMTHILVRANLLAAPFETRMLLRQGGAVWRIAEIESSEGHLNWTLGRAIVSPSGQFEPKH